MATDAAILRDLYARVHARVQRIDDAVEQMGGLERAHPRDEVDGVWARMLQGVPPDSLANYLIDLRGLSRAAESYDSTWVVRHSAFLVYHLLAAHFLRVLASWYPQRISAYAISYAYRCVLRPPRYGIDDLAFDSGGCLASSMQVWAERMRQEEEPVRRRALLLTLAEFGDDDGYGHQLVLALETNHTLYIIDNLPRQHYKLPVHALIEREFRRVWPPLRDCHSVHNQLPTEHLALGSCMAFAIRALLSLAILQSPYAYLQCPVSFQTERLFSRLLFMEMTRVRFWLMHSQQIWEDAWTPMYVPHDGDHRCYALTTDWIWLVRLPEVHALGWLQPSEQPYLLDELMFAGHASGGALPPTPWYKRLFFVDDSAYDPDGVRPAFSEEDEGIPWVRASYLPPQQAMSTESDDEEMPALEPVDDDGHMLLSRGGPHVCILSARVAPASISARRAGRRTYG